MPTVHIPMQWRDLTAGTAQVTVDAANVRQVIHRLEQQFPGISARALRGDTLMPGLSADIDGVMTTRLIAPVQPASEVHFLPALGGG